jgi:hypothetical protein
MCKKANSEPYKFLGEKSCVYHTHDIESKSAFSFKFVSIVPYGNFYASGIQIMFIPYYIFWTRILPLSRISFLPSKPIFQRETSINKTSTHDAATIPTITPADNPFE